MSIILNGTSGITNDATDLSYTGTLTGGTGVVNIGSGQLVKDASGNLGLGVTPSAWGLRAIQFSGGAIDTYSAANNYQMDLVANAYATSVGSYVYTNTSANGSGRYQLANAGHSWHIAPPGTAGNAISFTQAMTLDSSGNLLVGQTVAGGNIAAGGIALRGPVVAGSSSVLISHVTNTGTGNSFAEFSLGGNYIGGVIQNGTTGVSYTSSSDYRLKDTIAPMTGALAKVAALKPCTYKWKVDRSDGQGFIAHELQAVVPDCVTGEKDAVDSEGKPQYQGIDTSFLVATLTAAIQEQQAIIQSLTTRITALEAK